MRLALSKRERQRLTAAVVVTDVTVTPVTSSQLSSSSESPVRPSSIRTAPETDQRSGWDIGYRGRQDFSTAIRMIRSKGRPEREEGEGEALH
jgi:hypothetical protein